MPSNMKRAFLMVLLLFLGGVGAEISAILFINSGHLVYTLDTPISICPWPRTLPGATMA